MSQWRFGCGTKFKTWVPHGYSDKEIQVICGSTSPTGDQWQCDACNSFFDYVDYEKEALEWNEPYGEEYW